MINYVVGDATEPIGEGNKIIIHCCNDIGGWGRGFVLALSKKWRQPEEFYRSWAETGQNFELGQVQIVKVADDIMVGNMIGQHDTVFRGGVPPVRYEAIRMCLKTIAEFALGNNYTVHAPRFGSALAGGNWDTIADIIEDELCSKGVVVTIYDLP